MIDKPLEGLLVLDFSQFLSGPSAGLRLADLGARVIKVEKRDEGDICRTLYISNLKIDGDSSLFHAINRNKESFAADLKNADDYSQVVQLIERADVLIQNFRPGVMKRLQLDYETVKSINPRLIYGEITGYGHSGPWTHKPGQDLLVQAVSGLPYLNGNQHQPPVPFGLSISDMAAGAHLAQGILAALVQRGRTGQGAHVEVNLLESVLDFQFELLTQFLNDGRQLPVRSAVNNANAYISAPYGIYETQDGYLAIAMAPMDTLAQLLECPALEPYCSAEVAHEKRDEIKQILVDHLQQKKTKQWLAVLEPADIWCADVFNWNRLIEHEGFKVLDMVMEVKRENGTMIRTVRCPIRIDGQRLKSSQGSPMIGEHNALIEREFF